MRSSENVSTRNVMNSSGQRLNTVIWWGRSDTEYARNGVIRDAMAQLGIKLIDFKPKTSWAGHLEAKFASMDADAIWVPCFRQRDMASAKKWANKNNIPLLFDPLISSYDKQVFERKKFPPTSAAANRLLNWERQIFQMADFVIADTQLHAEFFEETLGVSSEKLHVIPVSAQESLFSPETEKPLDRTNSRYSVLYYGSYLELHGIDTVAECIASSFGTQIDWTLVGDGPMRHKVEKRCDGLQHVRFIDWIDYQDLPREIHNADLVLGVFGKTEKALRVIPNKVYQALACGRPVVTMKSDVYPQSLLESSNNGIYWAETGNSSEIECAIKTASEGVFSQACNTARETYELYFSNKIVQDKLAKLVY